MEEERGGTNDPSAEPEEDSVEPIADKFKEKKGGKIKSRRNTAPASTEGYQTIRTQLQNKRASINKTIGHEVELKKGANRLIRASSDYKSRETALLEAQYSDSKIQLLQQELASINNSLQAYQDESVRDVQIPLIPLLMKTTTKISFIKPFTDFINKHYYEDAGKFQEALYEFSEMRLTMCNPVKDQNGIDSMYEYYSQLYLVGKRFFGSREERQIVFIWYDAVNGIPAVQKSAAFEKSSVLFNIGAMHSQCAARQSRTCEQDIEDIILRFRRAAGVFEYVRDNFYQSPTLDMKKDTLNFFILLMKAQAQYLAWEKETMKGLKNDVASLSYYSSLTNTVSASYEDLRKTVETKEYTDYIPDAWAGLIKVLGAHMKALSHYYTALVHMTIVRRLKGSEKKETSASNGMTFPSNSELQAVIKKMYADNADNLDEITTIKISNQVSIARSQLDVANLLHGDSVRYEKQSKALQSMIFLHKFLSEHHERSLELMAEAAKVEKFPPVVAPMNKVLELEFKVIPPEFPEFKDLFAGLGPLSIFSAANNWEAPRCVKIVRGDTGYGFSVRSSKPVRISGVDKGSGAEAAGLKQDDYILAVNERDALYMSHDDVVTIVKQSQDWVKLTLSTPTGVPI